MVARETFTIKAAAQKIAATHPRTCRCKYSSVVRTGCVSKKHFRDRIFLSSINYGSRLIRTIFCESPPSKIREIISMSKKQKEGKFTCVRRGLDLHRRLPLPWQPRILLLREKTYLSRRFGQCWPPLIRPAYLLPWHCHPWSRSKKRGSSKQRSVEEQRYLAEEDRPLAMTIVKPGKKTSKGRQKIEIRRIEDKERRQVSLCKRKGGLIKKCSELHLLSGAHVAIAIFSKKEEQPQPNGGGELPATGSGRPSRGGSVFAMGTLSVDHVLRRFAPLPGDEDGLFPAHVEDAGAVAAERAVAEATARELEETAALAEAEKKRMDAIGNKVVHAAAAAGKRFWWEVDVEALGEAELPEFARALQRVREIVQREANKLQASAPTAVVAAPWHP